MKTPNTKIRFKLTTIVLTSIIVFMGCDSPEKKVTTAKENVIESKENLAQAEEDYKTELANYKKESNEKHIANERAIADFKKQVTTAKKELKESYEKQLVEMEQKNLEIKQRMDTYQDDGKEKWKSFKREYDHDMDELGKSLKDLTIENKK